MKINLAVFFGGKSVEHEVSIITALQAIEHLNPSKYNVIPIYITRQNEFYTGPLLFDIHNFQNLTSLLKNSQKVTFESSGNKTFLNPGKIELDVALPAVHGTNVEDGSLQGFLKMLDLPFAGPNVISSAICMDKYQSKILMQNAQIPVVPGLIFHLRDFVNEAEIIQKISKTFSYPVIVKPVNLGSSIGISLAQNETELSESLNSAFAFAQTILIEKAISPLKEINCAVLGDSDEVLASELEEPLTSAEILSFSDKYLSNSGSKGSKQTKPPSKKIAEIPNAIYLSPKAGMASLQRKIPAIMPSKDRKYIQDLAKKAFQTLGLSGVARIDFLVNTHNNEIFINEINTIPGSLSFYLFEPIGLSYSDLLDKLISLALKRKRSEDGLVYTFETNILQNAGGSKN